MAGNDAEASVGAKTRKSDRLLQCLRGYEQVVVLTHDNPDPDGIAAGWALLTLIRQRLSKPVRLLAGGAITRAENRHLVRLLQPPLELAEQLTVTAQTAIVLVDCGPEAANHLADGPDVKPTAVIDHHAPARSAAKPPFRDLRPSVTASASIAVEYLREQRVEPDAPLASALLYAIHSEARGRETRFARLDRLALTWLARRSDPRLIAEIENAPLSRGYFADLALAIQNTFVYEDVALCLLPQASGPEIVGEVADLLIRCESIHRVLCAAVVGEQVAISARTERAGDDAAELLRQTLAGLGHAGGHEHRAGGAIRRQGTGGAISDPLEDELRTRWLSACGVDRRRGIRLVARRDIVAAL